jgi:hypothetical protein
MKFRSRCVTSLLVGSLISVLYYHLIERHWAIEHVGKAVSYPLEFIFDWSCLAGALVSGSIDNPSPFGGWAFLIIFFSTVSYVVLWISERILARVKRDKQSGRE